MFFLNKSKTNYIPHFSFLEFDMHNHVLNGLDDGAKSNVESVELLQGLFSLGFKRIVATPHTMSSLYPNTKSAIEQAYHQLKEHIAGTKIHTALTGYASEYFLDDTFSDLRIKNQLLPFYTNHVLIEMSYLALSPNLEQEIFELQLANYQPVLAHPERYMYLSGDIAYIESLVAKGCQLQLNLLSLTNQYGKVTTQTARKLLDRGLYEWAGTDTHHIGHLNLLKDLMWSRAGKELVQYPNFLNKSAGESFSQ